MKYLIILLGVVCLALPTCAPAPEPEPEPALERQFDQAAEEAAIREATNQAIESINKGDIEAHVAFYADTTENFQGTRDRAAHVQLHQRQKDMHLNMPDEIGIAFLTPNVAIHKYRQEVSGTLDDDGNPLSPAKSYQARVYVKSGGKWIVKATFGTPIEE